MNKKLGLLFLLLSVVMVFLFSVVTVTPSTSYWSKVYSDIMKQQEKMFKAERAVGCPSSVEDMLNDIPGIEVYLSDDGKEHDYCRRKLNVFKLLGISVQNDTAFIMENKFDNIEADYGSCSTIFTKRNLLSYTFPSYRDLEKNSIILKKIPFYSLNMLRHVVRWDLKGLKEESEEHGIVSAHKIIITRVVFKGGKYRIDCGYFEDYLDLDRDYNDFYYYDHADLQTILKKIFE